MEPATGPAVVGFSRLRSLLMPLPGAVVIDGPRGEESAFDEARETLNARWISRLRSKPGAKQAYRLGVLVLGSAFIALGIALASRAR